MTLTALKATVIVLIGSLMVLGGWYLISSRRTDPAQGPVTGIGAEGKLPTKKRKGDRTPGRLQSEEVLARSSLSESNNGHGDGDGSDGTGSEIAKLAAAVENGDVQSVDRITARLTYEAARRAQRTLEGEVEGHKNDWPSQDPSSVETVIANHTHAPLHNVPPNSMMQVEDGTENTIQRHFAETTSKGLCGEPERARCDKNHGTMYILARTYSATGPILTSEECKGLCEAKATELGKPGCCQWGPKDWKSKGKPPPACTFFEEGSIFGGSNNYIAWMCDP